MKKLSLLVLAASMAGGGVACAEEWNGYYLGGDLGYVTGDSNANATLGGAWSTEAAALQTGAQSLFSASLSPDGYSIGVHAGLNHEFASKVVLGGEVSYDYVDANDSRRPGQTVATTTFPSLTYAPVNEVEVNGQFTARARLGYNFEPVMAYVSLGYTTADVKTSAEILSNGGYSKAGQDSGWRDGVIYGVGAEMRMNGPWSIRGEYQRADLGDSTFANAYRPGSTFTSPVYSESYKQDLTLDTFRIGVSYNY